ncbi:hypothetical protein E4U27_004828, partial [Claviceps purpurea]
SAEYVTQPVELITASWRFNCKSILAAVIPAACLATDMYQDVPEQGAACANRSHSSS